MRRAFGVLTVGAVLLAPVAGQAAGSPGFETVANATSSTIGASVSDALEDSELYEPVDLAGLRSGRLSVPAERFSAIRIDRGTVKAALSKDTFELPTPDGGLEEFAVDRTQVMEPRLAAAHPELRTYAGVSVDDPARRVVIDVTPLGMNASVRGSRNWVVTPAYEGRGTTVHAVARTEDLTRETPLVESEVSRRLQSDLLSQRDVEVDAPSGDVQLRTYRLALVNDPTYADFFGTENVLAQKVTLVNRVNQLYGDDFGVRFVLVDESESLNLDTEAKATGEDGPCGGPACYRAPTIEVPGMLEGCGTQTIGRTRTVLGQILGAGTYDIGHLLLGNDGGGLAYVGVAGRDYAGAGCSGLSIPRGDGFYVDYVAHEMGHQFAADHTFDGDDGFCAGNATDSSVEPGSGSSVMAYAGICGADDLQPHTDPYFSQRTLAEVREYVTTPGDDVVEVQHVSLSGFGANGDTITIGYDGDTRTLTRGSTYTKAGVTTAIEELTGLNVSISNWAFDPYFSQTSVGVGSGGQPDGSGFQVTFADSRDPDVGGDHDDVDLLSVTGGPGVTAQVGETARGGAPRSGGELSETGNRRPVVTAPADQVIPVRTPFRLEGSATDADGDALVYTWEQNDRGAGMALFDNDKRYGPLFRIFSDNASVSSTDSYESPSPGQNTASSEPVRVFPDMEQILRGKTNAADGTCPRVSGSTAGDKKLDCYSEFLPTKKYKGAVGAGDRTLHFRLTARDGNPDGGGTSYDDVALKVKKKAGPFLVTSHDDGKRLKAGKPTFVKWKVNRTRKLSKKVRVLLSTDNGRTWDTVLAKNTVNDGKKRVVLPSGVRASNAWFMVEARQNYFFDVSDKAFKIR